MRAGDLAEKHGQLAKPVPDGDPYSAAHMMASTLNGWLSYEYHFGPIDLTDEQYLDALECAKEGLPAEGPANKRLG